jgi:hypothetical protein
MQPLSAEVVIIGSGMGGGTTAHALARRGVDVLVLERGERLPRESENWSPRAVFIERRYKPAERMLLRKDLSGGDTHRGTLKLFAFEFGQVLLVADLLSPLGVGAVVAGFMEREVGHERFRCGPVPVIFVGIEAHGVAGADHLDRTAAALRKPDAFAYVDDLSERVLVPGGA